MITFKQFLAEDSTIDTLEQNVRMAFPDTKKRQKDVNNVTITKVIFKPEGYNLIVDGASRSNNTGTVHSQRIYFTNVKYVPVGTPNSAPLEGLDTAVETIKTASLTVQVACDCMDFRFRFANYNKADNSLAGIAPPPYQRVAGSTRPEVNPSHTPGACKHILKLAQHLQQKKIVI
jgi:hypothetical protein